MDQQFCHEGTSNNNFVRRGWLGWQVVLIHLQMIQIQSWDILCYITYPVDIIHTWQYSLSSNISSGYYPHMRIKHQLSQHRLRQKIESTHVQCASSRGILRGIYGKADYFLRACFIFDSWLLLSCCSYDIWTIADLLLLGREKLRVHTHVISVVLILIDVRESNYLPF